MNEIIENDLIRANDDVRRANSKARHKRDAWRKKYTQLAETIRLIKRERARRVNRLNNRNVSLLNIQQLGLAFVSNITLRNLQAQATAMMEEQRKIKNELRASAYPWI